MQSASNDNRLRYTIGKQETAQWNAEAGENSSATITYTAGVKQTQMSLVCSDNQTAAVVEFLAENPVNVYNFRLTHRCACWNGCLSKFIVDPSLPFKSCLF